ncbi:MAG: hypothetical protein ACLU3F_13295 [Blautia wexlerae]
MAKCKSLYLHERMEIWAVVKTCDDPGKCSTPQTRFGYITLTAESCFFSKCRREIKARFQREFLILILRTASDFHHVKHEIKVGMYAAAVTCWSAAG